MRSLRASQLYNLPHTHVLVVLLYRSQYVPLRRTPEPLRKRFSIDISYTSSSNSFKWTGRGSPIIDADGTAMLGEVDMSACGTLYSILRIGSDLSCLALLYPHSCQAMCTCTPVQRSYPASTLRAECGGSPT